MNQGNVCYLSWRNTWIINNDKKWWDAMTPPQLSGDAPIPARINIVLLNQNIIMSTFSKIYLQFMMMKISFLLFNCLPTYLQFSSQPYQTFSWLLGIILRSPLRTACSHKHKMHNKNCQGTDDLWAKSKWMQIKQSNKKCCHYWRHWQCNCVWSLFWDTKLYKLIAILRRQYHIIIDSS